MKSCQCARAVARPTFGQGGAEPTSARSLDLRARSENDDRAFSHVGNGVRSATGRIMTALMGVRAFRRSVLDASRDRPALGGAHRNPPSAVGRGARSQVLRRGRGKNRRSRLRAETTFGEGRSWQSPPRRSARIRGGKQAAAGLSTLRARVFMILGRRRSQLLFAQ